MKLKNKIIRCECGKVLTFQNNNGIFELKIKDKNIDISFPLGKIKCRNCNRIYILNCFSKPKKEFNYVNIN